MREIPLQDNSAALSFAEDLFPGKFDVVIFLTGVGNRILFGAVETKHPRERLVKALSRVPLRADCFARGTVRSSPSAPTGCLDRLGQP